MYVFLSDCLNEIWVPIKNELQILMKIASEKTFPTFIYIRVVLNKGKLYHPENAWQ